MIAKNGLISVHIASRCMCKSTVKGKIECYWFEAYVCVWIFFSDSRHYVIIELLEPESVSYCWQKEEWISDDISWERFIDQFISYDIRVSFEGFSYLLPKFNKFLVKVGARIVELIKYLPHIIAEII